MPFHNIFKKSNSKKVNKTEIKPKIIADVHEKNSLVIPILHELGCEVEKKPLKVGDYLIGNTIVERKTFGDFLNSMISKRLVEQLRQLKQYPKALLIIEGFDIGRIEKDPDAMKINPNAIRGFILSISLNYQIPVIFTEDNQETALYLKTLAKQQLKPTQPISLHSRIPKTKQEQKQYILESFPNIGPKTAEKLLKEFKTLSTVLNASQEELEKILKGKTKQFKELFEE